MFHLFTTKKGMNRCVLFRGSFQYKIKMTKSQVLYICLIRCYHTQQHVWEPIDTQLYEPIDTQLCVLFWGLFQYKIKMIKSQVLYICLIRCYHTQQHVWEPQTLSYMRQFVMTSSVTYTSHKYLSVMLSVTALKNIN